MFSGLRHSTASVQFCLAAEVEKDGKKVHEEVRLHEQNMVNDFEPGTETERAKILKIAGNFGEKFLKKYETLGNKPKISNRGRKKRDNKKNRKKQGTGQYFSSQLTFYIRLNLMDFNIYIGPKADDELCVLDPKDKNEAGEIRLVSYIYKVKVYRNCGGQIPGLKTEDPREYQEIVKVLRKMLKEHFNKKIVATKFSIFMQNYKSKITNNCHYEIRKLKKGFLEKLKTDAETKSKILKIKPSSHGKLLVYFKTPTEKKPSKTTTLTIYRKGSINIDGSIGRVSATAILAYFEKFLKMDSDYLYDPDKESSESDSSEYSESSYDGSVSELLNSDSDLEVLDSDDSSITTFESDSEDSFKPKKKSKIKSSENSSPTKKKSKLESSKSSKDKKSDNSKISKDKKSDKKEKDSRIKIAESKDAEIDDICKFKLVDTIINTKKSALKLYDANFLVDLLETCTKEVSELLLEYPEIVIRGKVARQRRSIGFFADENIEGYKYSGQIAKSQPLTKGLNKLMKIINKEFNDEYNGILINRYKNGEDYIGAHSDDEKALAPSGVISLSYGATRIFRVRDKESGKVVKDVKLQTCDLAIMSGDFQKEFTHEIPIEKRIKDERISFTFRKHTS